MSMKGHNKQDVEQTKNRFINSWIAIMELLKMDNDLDKPISSKSLEDPQSSIVKNILKIYSMESFIAFGLN